MEGLQYIYSDKIWMPCLTASEGDCFFHSVFGTRDEGDELYRDKYAKFRRMYWASFLTYYSSGDIAGALLDLLGRCFNANNNYLHKSVAKPDDYMEYINDVADSKYSVLVEEIPLFAALENIRIVLFIDNQNKAVVFDPNPEFLDKFPFRSINNIREVVICLVDNHFSRLNPVADFRTNKINSTVVQDQEINRKNMKKTTRKKTFEKLGSAGIQGSLYQINLLTMVLLNGLRHVENWRLSTEDKNAGKFDDLIFEYLPSEYTIMLQAKHKKNETKNKITYNQLISTDFKSEFSLPKYFVSYQQIRKDFKVQNIVICTNVGFDERTTKSISKLESLSQDSVLYFEGGDNTCYSFNSNSFPNLKQNILEYCSKYEKNKTIIICEQDIDSFLSHLLFFPNCLGDDTLKKVIEETMSKVKFSPDIDCKVVFKDINKRILDWFKEEKGRYLTQVEAKAFFCDLRSSKYCEYLNLYDISFAEKGLPLVFQKKQSKGKTRKNRQQQNQNELNDPTRIEHIIPDREYILNVVKIYQALPSEHKDKALFINPDESIEVQKQMIDAFEVQHYTILVMVCHNTIEDNIAIEICNKLKEILNNYKYKYVILVAEERNNLAVQIKTMNSNYYKARIDNIMFTDLSTIAQETFKQKKNINFQALMKKTSKWIEEKLDMSLQEFLCMPKWWPMYFKKSSETGKCVKTFCRQRNMRSVFNTTGHWH